MNETYEPISEQEEVLRPQTIEYTQPASKVKTSRLGLKITALALCCSLLGGAVIVEQIFSLPGLGQLTLTGINQRDYPVVQGCVLVIAFIYVMVNLITDILYAYIDPRISYD